MNFEHRSKDVLVVRPGYVRYEDLAQHGDSSVEDFFGSAKTKLLTVFGLVSEDVDYTRVMFYIDETDNSECEGIVIPTSCVLEVVYLAPEEEIPAIMTKPTATNGSSEPN